MFGKKMPENLIMPTVMVFKVLTTGYYRNHKILRIRDFLLLWN